MATSRMLRIGGGMSAWLILLAMGLWADRPVSNWVYSSKIYENVKSSSIAWVVKWPGDFRFTLVLAAVVMATHPWKWRAGGFICLSGIMAGLFYVVIKWIVGRTRPIANGVFSTNPFGLAPFRNGLMGLLGAGGNLAFPSGHTCLSFATAAALGICLPRWKILFYAGAALVGVERILEGAHYPSDVIAGAGFGILAVILTQYLCGLVFEKPKPVDTKP